MNCSNILETKQLTKTFGGLVAVNQMDLCVQEGARHAIIGPNGSGKTTLVNLITGYYTCNGGTLSFQGKDITGVAADQRTSFGMTRTFQNIRLLDELSVYDNIALGLYSATDYNFLDAMLHTKKFRTQEKMVSQKVSEVAEELKISNLLRQGILKLPYGQRRLVEIARALISNPKLILLDEPAAGMNTLETVELGNIINRISAKGITIVLIEHNMDFIKDISSVVTVMESGMKIAEGDYATISKDAAVVEAYLGKGSAKYARN